MIDGWILKSGLILAGMHRVYEDRLILFFSSSSLKRNGKSGYLDEFKIEEMNTFVIFLIHLCSGDLFH